MTHPSSGTHGLTAVLLSIHVLAAIVLIGPITVAASLFPRYARAELVTLTGNADPAGSSGPGRRTAPTGAAGVAAAMHRITSGYAVASIVVPVFGIGTALRLHVIGQYWLWVSLLLTALAALLLAGRIVPLQARLLAVLEDTGQRSSKMVDAAEPGALLARLGMLTGIFGLLWAAVVVLMIFRPGSTTGAGA